MEQQYFLAKQNYLPKVSPHSQQGSTLIEVIVAVFVLSFGVLALMLAQLGSVNSSISAANQAEVTRAVQNYIEVMYAQAKITAKKEFGNTTTAGEQNSIAVLLHDYSNHDTDNLDTCVQKLGLHLNNATVSQCTIKKGKITVAWTGQKQNNDEQNDNDFTYSLSVDSTPANVTTP